MCGRYRLSRRKQIIEEHFDRVSGEKEWTPRYNMAPTQPNFSHPLAVQEMLLQANHLGLWGEETG
jgi:putative SOS response-associated peptidase YedK